MLRQSTNSQLLNNRQQQKTTSISPCLKPICRKLKKYQNITLIYLDKSAFFYPYCNRKLKLFGNSTIQENQPQKNENKCKRPYIPRLKLEFQEQSNFFQKCQKQNTERIYNKLSHRSIYNLLNEINHSRNTPRPQSALQCDD